MRGEQEEAKGKRRAQQERGENLPTGFGAIDFAAGLLAHGLHWAKRKRS